MIEPVQYAASILAADICRLGEEVEGILKAGVRIIHVDVMGGRFVPGNRDLQKGGVEPQSDRREP